MWVVVGWWGFDNTVFMIASIYITTVVWVKQEHLVACDIWNSLTNNLKLVTPVLSYIGYEMY